MPRASTRCCPARLAGALGRLRSECRNARECGSEPEAGGTEVGVGGVWHALLVVVAVLQALPQHGLANRPRVAQRIVEQGPPANAGGRSVRVIGLESPIRDPSKSRWPRRLAVAVPTGAFKEGGVRGGQLPEGRWAGRGTASRRTRARACESPRREDVTSDRPQPTPEACRWRDGSGAGRVLACLPVPDAGAWSGSCRASPWP